MYLALIVLPILGSTMSGFVGRKIGVSGAQLITCTSVIITTILAIFAFLEVGFNNIPVTIHLFRWIDVEALKVSWAFNFDSLTVSMLIPVLIVSSLVHVYSIGYMSHDPHNQRFFSYLSLFTFMMVILVTADNFLLMFVGWEGVGVCSYLLVSFWFTRIAANQSSLAAFLTNRVGDCFLTIGMFAILWSIGDINYFLVFSLSPYFNEKVIIIIGICLLIGAMAKSSQVGLHVWLPMAMEGPTPVSALIHAATMVTAGVYLLMRTSPIIEYSSIILLIILWVGAITTVFSSLVGLFQQDIKKVIAYSTMSQLGMMVIAVGLSSYSLALFHLVNHAFYKALLFLGAGAVIHAVNDNQDFRKYGGLITYLPLSYSVMLIASLSLVAFPFMTGFYSKDLIIESAFGQYNLSSIIIYFIASIAAMFTTLYSVKVLHITFLSNPNGPLINYKDETSKAAHEGNKYMSLPLIILAIFSIYFGFITKDIFIGLGSDFFSDNALFLHPSHEIMLNTEFSVPVIYKLLPLMLTISLTIISVLSTEFYPSSLMEFKYSIIGYNIFSFLNQRFGVESIYNKYISGIILFLGGQTSKDMDKGIVEKFGPFGLETKLTDMSKSINNLSTGLVTNYALYILIGLLFFFNILYFSEFMNINYILMIIFLTLISVTCIFGEKPPKDPNLIQSNALDFVEVIQATIVNLESTLNVCNIICSQLSIIDQVSQYENLITMRNTLIGQQEHCYRYIDYLLDSSNTNEKLAGYELYNHPVMQGLDTRKMDVLKMLRNDAYDTSDLWGHYPDYDARYESSHDPVRTHKDGLKYTSSLKSRIRTKINNHDSILNNPQVRHNLAMYKLNKFT
jgi:NADH-ubiquinone oxidoreductase chain 5